MSRTSEVPQTQSPVKAHVFFNGQLGKFSVLRGENEPLQEIPFPFHFVVLDADTSKVGGKLGKIAKDAVKFKSNFAHPKYGRELRVWLENDPGKILAVGTWGSIKNRPELSDAKFVSLVFSLVDFGNGKEIACIHLSGRALAAWLDATQKKKIDPCGDHCFVVKGVAQSSGEGVSSLVPVFETGKISQETADAASDADFVLQSWLCEQFDSPAKDLGIGAAGANRSNASLANNDAFFPPLPKGAAGIDTDDLTDYEKGIPVPMQPTDDLPF